MLDLILALQSLPAARLLPSLNGRGSLFGDLSKFNSVVDSDDLTSDLSLSYLKKPSTTHHEREFMTLVVNVKTHHCQRPLTPGVLALCEAH